jgi:hypothetical protein
LPSLISSGRSSTANKLLEAQAITHLHHCSGPAMNGDVKSSLDAENLRKRNVPIQARSEDEARNAVLQLNAHEERTSKDEKDRKTFGRTPDGTGRTSYDITRQSSYLYPTRHCCCNSHNTLRTFWTACFSANCLTQSSRCLSLTIWCRSSCLHLSPRTCLICSSY